MKHKVLLLTSVAALALGLASCSKNESVTTPADDANKAAGAASKAAETAKGEAAKAADAAKVEAARVADAAKAEAAKVEAAKLEAAKVEVAKAEAARVEAAKAAENAKTQELIVKATSLIGEGKFSDASSVLQQLAGQTLSSDQQRLVDGLKEQIQKALAAKAAENAASSVGNLLKK